MKKVYLSCWFLILLFFVSPSFFSQNSIAYVSDTNDSGVGSLRAAVSSGADTIFIDIAGELKLMTSIVVSNNVKIIGPSAVHFKINLSSLSSSDGIFKFNNYNVELSGVTIKNGNDQRPFSITPTNPSGNILIEDCLFENNKVNGNGGVFNFTGLGTDSLKVLRCSFFENQANGGGTGGVLYLTSGNVEFYNCTFHNNLGDAGGGAIRIKGGIAKLINNTFYNNYINSGSGLDVFRSNSSSLYIRNNIFKHDVSMAAPVQGMPSISGSQNFTNLSGLSSIIQNSSNIGLSSQVTQDGFGLKYFVFNNVTSDCIDVDAASPVDKFDARHSWRDMIGKIGQNFSPYIDAGAVEYTPFIVSSGSNSGPGTFDDVMNTYLSAGSLTSSNYSIVFEIPSTLLSDRQILLSQEYIISPSSSLIINGFTQKGSRVPGPKNSLGIVEHGKMGVELNGSNITSGSNINVSFFDPLTVIIAGVSITNNANETGLNCMISTQGRLYLEGNHIGVNIEGDSQESNFVGVNISTNTLASGFEIVGVGSPFFMNGYNHNSRNVISSNTKSQIELNVNSILENNFIGLNSKGNLIYSTSSRGVFYNNFSTGVNIRIGGANEYQANYFGGQDTAIHFSQLMNSNIQNNLIGFMFDGITSASNNVAVYLEKGNNNIIESNFIGNCINNGDAISLKNTDTTYIGKNIIGLAKDYTRSIIEGSGIKIYGSSGVEGAVPFILGGYNSIKNNTISSCNVGAINYRNTAYFNNTNNMLEPSKVVYFKDKIQYNVIGYDTTANNRNFSNNKGIIINDSIQGVNISTNLIGLNNQEGIELKGNGSLKYIKISKNSLFLNGGISGLGIDLDGNGLANIDDGAIPSSNRHLLPPKVLGAVYCSTNNSINLKVKTKILDASKSYRLEFFKVDPNNQEGMEFVKDTLFLPNTLALGWFEDTLSFSASILNVGEVITTTLTEYGSLYNSRSFVFDSVASTSEFGLPFTINNYSPSLSVYDDTLCVGDSSAFQFFDYGSYNGMFTSVSPVSLGESSYYFFGNTAGIHNVEIYVDSLGCAKTLDTSIIVLPSPVVNLGNDTSYCEGAIFNLNSIASGGQWEDINHVPLANISPLVTGNVSYVYMASNANCQDRDTIHITSIPVASGIDTQVACDSYVWIDGVTYTSSNNSATHTLTRLNGCDSVVTLNLTINSSNTGMDTQIACGSFVWIDGNTYTSSNNSAIHTLTNIYGCDSVVTLNLTMNASLPIAPEVASLLIRCEDKELLIIDTELSNQNLQHLYYLDNNISVQNSPNNIVNIDASINLFDSISIFVSDNGCVSDTVVVQIDFVPVYTVSSSELEICEGDSIEFKFNNLGNTILDSLVWGINNFSDSLIGSNNLIISSGEIGLYSFLIYKSGCEFKDSALTTLSLNCENKNEISTSAFSPNGDLFENTTFVIDLGFVEDENVKDVKVNIYNRWGDIVFKTDNYDNDQNVWHGNNLSGDAMPEGTYFYIVEVPSKSFSTSGWVYLNLK